MSQNADETNWKKSVCTCPSFYKKYICKHIIRTAIRTIPTVNNRIPLAAKTLPLNSKRKTGRPALARKALVRQPFVSLMQTDDDDNGDNYFGAYGVNFNRRNWRNVQS